jgi:hypothetical protein
VLRVASNLASNELTWEVLMQHPVIGELTQRYAKNHQAGLTSVAGVMSEATAESLEATRYLEALRELLASKRVILLPKDHVPTDKGEMEELDRKRDRVIGWRDIDGSAYLLPKTARQAVERLLGLDGLGDLSNTALYRQLDSLNMLASKDKDRHTKTTRMNEGVERLLHLRAEAIEAQDATDSLAYEEDGIPF